MSNLKCLICFINVEESHILESNKNIVQLLFHYLISKNTGKICDNFINSSENETEGIKNKLHICQTCSEETETLFDLHLELEKYRILLQNEFISLRKKIIANFDRSLLKNEKDDLRLFGDKLKERDKHHDFPRICLKRIQPEKFLRPLKENLELTQQPQENHSNSDSDPESDSDTDEFFAGSDCSDTSIQFKRIRKYKKVENQKKRIRIRKRTNENYEPPPKRPKASFKTYEKDKLGRKNTQAVYICTNCQYKTKSLPTFEAHLRTHETPQKDLNCDQCNLSFSTQQYLSFHQEQHQGLLTYACDVCRKRVPSMELRSHLKSHGVDKIITCRWCSFISSSYQKYYKVHVEAYHRLGNSDSPCDICEERFNSGEKLFEHLASTHGLDFKPIKCNTNGCKRIFFTKASLRMHQPVHFRKHKCDLCDFRTAFTSNLTAHLRTHKEELRLRCDQCPLSFTERRKLRAHMVKAHDAVEEKYSCKSCDQMFANRFLRDSHIKMTHWDKSKLPTCSVCGKKFKFISELNLHEATHLEKSHICEDCGLHFKSKHRFDTHLHLVHKTISKFKCDFKGCKKTFFNKLSLRNHKISHTDRFRCKECQKGFLNRHNLERHERIHSGNRPFQCDQCPEAFFSIEVLQTHKRRAHHAAKLKCEYCDKEYGTVWGLACHRKMEHIGTGHTCPVCKKSCENETRLKHHIKTHKD